MASGIENFDEMTINITQVTTEDGEVCNNVKNDLYGSLLTGVVHELYLDESMVDVILCVSGQKFRAHRMVLSSCSSFFHELLCHTNEEQTIFLPDINSEHLQNIISFCYGGEIRVPSTEISEMLALAKFLKIEGLSEVAGLVDSDETNTQEQEEESEEFILQDDEYNSSPTNHTMKNYDKSPMSNKLKKRKSVCKKDYSEEHMAFAVEEIKSGLSLLEAAEKYNIPKSTLYIRIKSLGVKINNSRFAYTINDMRDAIKAVADGSSLQQAADIHGIPKTVLWRRIQKEGVQIPKRDRRKTYGTDKREAALQALQRGEALTKVASEFDIPKTTLFRDKIRLINQGKLSSSYLKQRKITDEDLLKEMRLSEAITACKQGKLSQAAASKTYDIPKTTIWRHLHKKNYTVSAKTQPTKIEKKVSKDHKVTKESSVLKAEDVEEFEPTVQDEAEMCITYINEENIGDEPVIILASKDGNPINIRSDPNLDSSNDNFKFIPCEIDNFDEN